MRPELLPPRVRDALARFGPNWQARGACVDTDRLGLFFVPDGRPDPASEQVRVAAAKAICARCPVRQTCLEYALAAGEDGIWGGMTEPERRQLALRRRIAATRRGDAA